MSQTVMSGKRTFLDNRHPEYDSNASFWKFLRESYTGGPDYQKSGNLFRFNREREDCYKARLARTARVNYTSQVINLIVSYLFKNPPQRKTEKMPNSLQTFFQDVDGEGTGIDDFMETVAVEAAITGITYLIVDKPAAPNITGTIREKTEKGLNPYVYQITALDVLDIVFNPKTGHVEQALIRETGRPDNLDLSHKRENDGLIEKFRLWQKKGESVTWSLWVLDDKGEPLKEADGMLSINRVPIIPVRLGKKRSRYTGKSMAADFAFLDRSVYNYESCLDQIIYDQTFSVLALEYDGVYDEFYSKWDKTMSTKSIIPFRKDGAPPAFISPDASQGSLISETIQKKITQIYQLSNLLSEVGEAKKSAAPESGVAKAYEFEKLNAILGKFADSIEAAEEAMLEIVLLFENDSFELKEDHIDYPDTFDVKSLMQELSELNQVTLIGFGMKFEAYLKKQAVKRMAPKLEPELLEAINQEIDAIDPEKEAEEEANRHRDKE
jgi:hypothetical protein